MSSRTGYTATWHQSMSEIDRESWDRLALQVDSPFLEYDWLRLLEESKSICPQTGWIPCHLTLHAGNRLAGAAALYVKTHSEGEFVWDYMWADVAQRLGRRYYPKLVGMSPATPAVGYRFLIDPDEEEGRVTSEMIQAIEMLCRKNDIHSSSFLWADPDWKEHPASDGYIGWMHQSYLWDGSGFSSFDDYLAVFDKNQRKNIRKERRSMEEQGIRLEAFSGEEIPESWFPRMYDFYARTNAQFGMWAAKYLTRDFFTGLYPGLRHRLLFVAACREGNEKPIGMSFLVRKGRRMYGRYWGTSMDLNHLHFNACYYAPIEWAIGNGVTAFDPGAGSSHKLRRGFAAVPNWSMHRFYDKAMDAIMRAHIDEINRAEQDQIDAMNEALPFSGPRPGGEGAGQWEGESEGINHRDTEDSKSIGLASAEEARRKETEKRPEQD